MKTLPILLATTALLFASGAQAAGDLSRASPQEIVIEMGTSGDRMYFKPNHLDLETGKAYKIVLRNVDETKHEFAGHELMEKLFTRKVEIADARSKFGRILRSPGASRTFGMPKVHSRT